MLQQPDVVRLKICFSDILFFFYFTCFTCLFFFLPILLCAFLLVRFVSFCFFRNISVRIMFFCCVFKTLLAFV